MYKVYNQIFHFFLLKSVFTIRHYSIPIFRPSYLKPYFNTLYFYN